MKHHWLHQITMGIALTIVMGCTTSRVKESGLSPTANFRNQKIEPEARNLFFQAERLFAAKNYDEARQLYQTVKTKFPKGRAHMLSSYRLGTIFYYREDYQNAAREFELFLSRHPQSELAFDVTYNLAAAHYQLGNYDKAYQALSRFRLHEIQAQGSRRAEVIFQLTAQTAAALGNHAAAIAAYAEELALPIEEKTRTPILEAIDSQLTKMGNRNELERLQAEITEPVTQSKIAARLKSLAASDTIALVESSTPAPPATTELESTTGSPLHATASAYRRNIGVILPLTGKFAAYGRKALDGILLAAGSFHKNADESFELFIEDSGSNPAMAQQAVDTLYYEHRVIAILGPLSWKESLAVAERSQQLGVLNLSFSAKEGLSEKGAYLFQNALTPKVQVENLVNHVVMDRGFKRFAILAPNDSFGKDMANQFWELTEKFGGRVVAYETYSPEEKDFQANVKALTGLTDPKYRKLEVAKLNEYIQQQKAKTGKEPKSARLPPIVDFDAIFIPDGPKNVSQIAASLAYFDVSGVALLGTTEWNTEQFYKRGGKYVEGAIFPGAVNLATRNPRQRDFIRAYADAFGSAPDVLAGQSFEAMALLSSVIQKGASDRNEVVVELSRLKDFDSPLGLVSFDNMRLARRRLPVYSLGPNGTLTEAQ